MISISGSNLQDPKAPTSYQRELADIEYSEGTDELTIDFLTTKHDVSHLLRMASTHIDEDEEEQRDDYEGNEDEFSVVKDNAKSANEYSYESIEKKEKEWYEHEPDDPCEEMMTVGIAVAAVGFLAVCGFLGYLFLTWLG